MPLSWLQWMEQLKISRHVSPGSQVTRDPELCSHAAAWLSLEASVLGLKSLPSHPWQSRLREWPVLPSMGQPLQCVHLRVGPTVAFTGASSASQSTGRHSREWVTTWDTWQCGKHSSSFRERLRCTPLNRRGTNEESSACKGWRTKLREIPYIKGATGSLCESFTEWRGCIYIMGEGFTASSFSRYTISVFTSFEVQLTIYREHCTSRTFVPSSLTNRWGLTSIFHDIL